MKQTTLVTKSLGKLICERDRVAARDRDERLLEEMTANPRGTVRQSLIPGLSAGLLVASNDGPRGQLFPQPLVKTADGFKCLLDEATGMTFRIVVENDTDPVVIERVAGEWGALSDIPVELVVIGTEPLTSDAPSYAYQDVDGVLVSWMQRHDCAAVIVRPDHYVYGGCRKVEDAVAMIRELAAALRSDNAHKHPTPAACA
ncbi:hypothetical protein [Paraburkholderia dipogonis]|uniref:hypothetical protein n=1 Tax=Paraburkholderia dipogonis TaxID=1211383 RepID=UPI001AD816DA|nr:hypothetical protein [Paraburkholderia dipogonis]